MTLTGDEGQRTKSLTSASMVKAPLVTSDVKGGVGKKPGDISVESFQKSAFYS